MKAINKYFTLIAIALFMITTTVFAGGVEFEDERYINDIPFSTAEVYHQVILNSLELVFEEEAYVDDIPFNTEIISEKIIFEEAMVVVFDFEEEDYINDIPFDTEALSKKIQLRATKCAK
jgi:hypothetical protein